MHPQSSPPIIYRSSPPIIYRTLQNCQNCFSHPAKIVKLSQCEIMTEKSESISMKTFFFFFFFFFWRTPNFWQKKRQNFRFWPKIVTKFRWRPFFFFFLETMCFWAEITNVFPRFPRNSVAICATFDGSVSSPPIIFTDIRAWFLLPRAQSVIYASVMRLAKNLAGRVVYLQFVVMYVAKRATS